MRMFLTDDGKEFLARDEADLVAQLRASSFTPSSSPDAFMRDVADRARFQDQRIALRSDTPENFVSDMLAAGLLSERPVH
jgi:hypothetical protein